MTSTHETIRVGNIEVTPLLDGIFPIGLELIPDADCERGRALLEQAARPKSGPTPEPIFSFYVKGNGQQVLIDSGCGRLFGPGLGKVPDRLASLDVSVHEIDMVILTHMHPDHIGGLLLDDGSPRFTQAELVVTKMEAEYWLDEKARRAAPIHFQPFFDAAASVLERYHDRIRYLDDNPFIGRGLTSLPLPGHTPGHIGVYIEDGEDKLLVWGDVIHSATLQLAQPNWPIAFDVEPKRAADTRSALFQRVADEQLRVLGMHLDGAGYLRRAGSGFIFSKDSR